MLNIYPKKTPKVEQVDYFISHHTKFPWHKFPLAQNSIFSPESTFFAHYLKISEALLAARHVISADVISCFLECFCAETPKKR